MPSIPIGPDLSLDPLERVWSRLAPRLARSATRSRGHQTRRLADMPVVRCGGGLVRLAHEARAGDRLRWIDLPPSARLDLPLHEGSPFALLLCRGEAQVDGRPMAALDYCEAAAAPATLTLASGTGARVMVHERAAPCRTDGVAAPAPSCWQTLAPGLARRLLAPPRGGVAPFLVRFGAGAVVASHRHCHDETCLLLEGEIHSEDQLLLPGDFQLAPAGAIHHDVASERGGLLYVHGDVDLDIVIAQEAD